MKSRVFSVIVTYNPDMEVLQDQFLLIKNQISGIIYVDNGSENISDIEKLVESCKSDTECFFIKNKENRGLGAAQNQGVKLALNQNPSHLLLLDDDSSPEVDFVEKLLISEKNLIDQGVKVGLVGPVIVDVETGNSGAVSIMDGFLIHKIHVTKPTSVSYLIASGSLIRSEVLSIVGLIDEDLFIDGLDLEWCFRAKSFGFEIIACPDAIIKHRLGDRKLSIGNINLAQHSPQRRYYITRNSILFNKFRHIPLGFRIRTGVLSVLKSFSMLLISKDRKSFFYYNMLGIRDGIKGCLQRRR